MSYFTFYRFDESVLLFIASIFNLERDTELSFFINTFRTDTLKMSYHYVGHLTFT